MEEDSKPCEENEDDMEDVDQQDAKLDVNRLVGQSLFKNKCSSSSKSSLKLQAQLLTGAPLIKRSPGQGGQLKGQVNGGQNCYLNALQQHQASNFYLYLQQLHLLSTPAPSTSALVEEAEDTTKQNGHESQDGSLPRILKPRKRRRHGQGYKNGLGIGSDYQVELDYEDETRYLPLDLLNDGSCSDDSLSSESKVMSESETDTYPSPPSLSPIQRPSDSKLQNDPVKVGVDSHALLKHSESLRFDKPDPESFSSKVDHHPQLRKTYSWTCSDENSFSLFPKSSDSDLLSNVRNNLVGLPCEPRAETVDIGKKTSNLEEALKTLRIGINESSLSRKF